MSKLQSLLGSDRAERQNVDGDPMVVLFSGLPATGKSSFCRYLAHEHGFAHYNLEIFPDGWPQPSLKPLWDADRLDFVRRLEAAHPRVALDWGFPPSFLPWVEELSRAGVRIVWFSADPEQARKAFTARGGVDIGHFDLQIEAIRKANLPDAMTATTLETLGSDGQFLSPSQILEGLKSLF